jgi:hypothetical protein
MATQSLEAQFWAALGFPLQIVALLADNPLRAIHLRGRADLPKVIGQAQTLNAEGWNIYYEVNLSSQEGKRSKASHISALCAVVGDIDAKSGRSIEQCREAVSCLPLPPSFVLFTGGGLQVVYLLQDRPEATPENVAIHERIGRGLAALTDGDSVFDLPRIMRLPGFINHPTSQKRAQGREAARVVVEAALGHTYALGELAAHFAPTPTASCSSVLDDLAGGLSGGPGWFEQLSPEDKNACLAEMLQVPAVIALADTSDGAPSPNWRTVLAACSRSGAPDAYRLTRDWAATSPRFNADDFDRRWRSYANS